MWNKYRKKMKHVKSRNGCKKNINVNVKQNFN